MLTKTCTKCYTQKEIEHFYKRGRGYKSQCKECCMKNDQLRKYNFFLIGNEICAICGCSGSKEKLCIDHEHLTGKIRGVLCNKCNTAIGLLKEDIELLDKAKKYLIESRNS